MEHCSLLLSVNHRKITKATAPSTEGRCVMQSWQKTRLFFSTPPTQTLRKPKSYWFTQPGMNWKLWAHSAGRLLRLCYVTTSSKSATPELYLLLPLYAGKIARISEWENSFLFYLWPGNVFLKSWTFSSVYKSKDHSKMNAMYPSLTCRINNQVSIYIFPCTGPCKFEENHGHHHIESINILLVPLRDEKPI